MSKKEKRKKDWVKKREKIECYQDKLLSKENVIDRILMTIVQRKVILLTRPKFIDLFFVVIISYKVSDMNTLVDSL